MFVIASKLVNKYNQIMAYSGYWVEKELEGNRVKTAKINLAPDVVQKLAVKYKVRHMIKLVDGVPVPLEDLKIERYTTFGKVYDSGNGLRFYTEDDIEVNKENEPKLIVTEHLHKEEYTDGVALIKCLDFLTDLGYIEKEDKSNEEIDKELIIGNAKDYVHRCINKLNELGFECVRLDKNDDKYFYSLDVVNPKLADYGINIDFEVKKGYCISYYLNKYDLSTKVVEFVGTHDLLGDLINHVSKL